MGAIVFAGLVLIAQTPNFITHNPDFNATAVAGMTAPEYLHLVVGVLSFTVLLSGITVLASLAFMAESSKFKPKGRKTANDLVEWLIIGVFLLFMFSVLLIVVPVSSSVATWVFGLTIFLTIVVFLALLWAQRRT